MKIPKTKGLSHERSANDQSRYCESADGRRFRNTEVLTLTDGMIHAVEVYFGWSLLRPAMAGEFVAQP